MLMTWLADFFLIIIFLLIFVLSWCRVKFVGAIGRHITILDFKRFAAYIIFLIPRLLNARRNSSMPTWFKFCSLLTIDLNSDLKLLSGIASP